MPGISIPKENEKASVFAVTLKPVYLLQLFLQLDNRLVEGVHDIGAQKSFLSSEIV